MTISGGGSVTTQYGILAPYTGSTGELLIEGANSYWSIAETLSLANQGSGTMVINDGGQLYDRSAMVAGYAGSDAAIIVNGDGSSWHTTDDLILGYGGDASLTISNGGLVESGLAYAAISEEGTSRITLTGDGSRWDNQGLFVLGYYGDAELTVANNATFSVDGDFVVAAAEGSRGVINIGSAEGDAPVSPGVLEAQTITFGDGDGAVVFNHSDVSGTYQFTPAIEGTGRVDSYSGVTVLAGQSSYSGATTIYGGEIAASGANVLSANSAYSVGAAGQLNLAGYSNTINSLDNAGVVGLTGTADSGYLNSYSGASTVLTVENDVTNSGVIYIGGTEGLSLPGNSLVVNGNYMGDNGQLYFNTVLGGDDSATDTMTVEGNTSGTTYVSVSNAGGSGAQTLEGIRLIQVNGVSDGEFVQSGRIAAGAYDYSLVRGQRGNSGNWYLSNSGNSLRPEGGSYTANLAAANNMFVTRLHDRLGETQYIDALSGEQKVTSMWMRHVGGHTNWRDSSGKLQTQSNSYVLQLGGDVAQWSQNGLDRWHLGVMAGYGNQHSNTHSSHTGYSSKGSTNGYSGGVYATWYANDQTHQGGYLDSWAQYSWFDNHVKGQDLRGESYKSRGVSGSVELGYTRQLGAFTGSKGNQNEWFIQPQAQVVWMGIKAADFREDNGTRISGEGNGNIQTRLGIRSFLKGHSALDNGKEREFEPFVALNWIHNTQDFGTQMNGVSIRQGGTRNLGEIKTGVEGKLKPELNIWGNVGVQLGDQGYHDTSAMIGIKYNFK